MSTTESDSDDNRIIQNQNQNQNLNQNQNQNLNENENEYIDNNDYKLYKIYFNDLLGLNNIENKNEINKEYVKKSKLQKYILSKGILIDDKRFNNKIIQLKEKITFNDFIELVNSNILLFKKIFENDLIISNWNEFTNNIDIIYNKTINYNKGNIANYIPQLANVSGDLYALSICTIDGQIYNQGDFNHSFCVQSCSKPITYLIACDLKNPEYVHNFVGTEPSGRNFNELCLNTDNIPHNPLINSGAIMCASLINYNDSLADRFDLIIKYWSKLAGNSKINFSTSVYLSEKSSADRNNCLAYMMQEKDAFSNGIDNNYKRNWNNNDLTNTLDFYFQCCSIEINCTQASIIASTLANGGICPITNERVFSNEIVKNALSLMSSCGMYDYSGEWAYKIGLPSKSGVSGLIITVIPKIMGIATFSPKLDELGNSSKGILFFTELSKLFSFHIYDNILSNNNNKVQLNNQHIIDKQFQIYSLLHSASIGDLNSIIILYSKNIDLNSSDYDKRTALHLACSEGQIEIIKYLISKNVKKNITDRWNNTPLDDFNKYLQTIDNITLIHKEILQQLS